MSLDDFIIAAARRAAEEAILDQRVIMVCREDYEHMLSALDRPPESGEQLCKLLQTIAPWDK